MALFRRKKTQTISELEDYYANRNNRAGMAWLMAFLSLLVTMAVIAGLFFGGRWVYRSLRSDDTTKVATTTSSNEDTSNSGTLTVESEGRVTEGAASTDVPSSERRSSDTDSNTNTSSNSSSASSSNQSSTSTVTTGASATIPNTGAGNIIYILPLSAMVLGYAVALRRQRNNR